MELIALCVLICGLVVGLVFGYYICRRSRTELDARLRVIQDVMQREHTQTELRSLRAPTTAGFVGRAPTTASELAPPPRFDTTSAEADEIRRLWEQLYGGNKKEEPKPATKPESKREHKRRIQLNDS